MQSSAGSGMGMPSIQTDGCIIEEQPDHLVIALRVRKDLISDNLHLMAALAELSTPSSIRVTGQRITAPYVATDPPRRKYFSAYKLLQIFGIASIVTIHMPSMDGDAAHASHAPVAPSSSVLLSGHEPLYPEYVFPHIKGLEYCTLDHLTVL
jgi:hypothetical protein